MRLSFMTPFLVIAAASCGGGSKPAPQEPAPEPVVPDDVGGDAYGGAGYGASEPEAAPAEPPPPPQPPSLVGTWASPCAAGQTKGEFTKMTFTFTTDRWDLAYDSFKDKDCKKPLASLHFAGAYKAGQQSATVANAWEGDFNFEQRELTVFDAKAAKKWAKACGVKLKVKQKVDLQEKGCAALGLKPAAECAVDYDVFAVEGRLLRFGVRPADNDLCAAEKRPTALDNQLELAYQIKPVGNADCDAYLVELEKFLSCPKIPPEAQQASWEGFRAGYEAMSAAAKNPDAAPQMTEACKQGMTALQQNATQMGC